MLTKLTKEQRQVMYETRDYWINKVYSGKTKLNKSSAKELIDFCYKAAGIKPPKTVVWLSSPIGCHVAVSCIEKLQEKPRVLDKGASVRDSVWASVGDSVRDSVWASVGDSVRDSVWDSVWDSVRASVRASVWASVGDSVRDSVRASVWASVRASVGDSVRDSVRDSVWASVWASVRASVWDSVRASVRDSVRASVGDSVRDSVRASVWASVRASVWDSVRDSVWDSVWASVGDSSYRASIYDYAWVSFCDYFINKIKIQEHKLFSEYCNLIDKGNIFYWVPYQNIAFVSDFPTEIHSIQQGSRLVLHNESSSPAIRFGDGWELYFLNGVRLERQLYLKIINRKLSFKEIQALQNSEHRVLALKYAGRDTIIKSTNAELIDTGKKACFHFDYSTDDGKLTSKVTYNKLYLIRGVYSQDAYFLSYDDPSTGREYFEGVEPKFAASCRDADACMAKRHHLTKEEYMNLKIET